LGFRTVFSSTLELAGTSNVATKGVAGLMGAFGFGFAFAAAFFLVILGGMLAGWLGCVMLRWNEAEEFVCARHKTGRERKFQAHTRQRKGRARNVD
jgi:hypothetical protein